jgi:hypothetical protein
MSSMPMVRRGLLLSFMLIAGRAGAQVPEIPSSAQTVFQSAVAIPAANEPAERFIHSPGWYGSGGILVAPPILFMAGAHGSSSTTSVFSPLPSPWATIGYRRANDVAWQVSFLLVPIHHGNASGRNPLYEYSTTGLNMDRISTNRSPWPDIDMRWQVGLRIVGVGIDGIPIPFALGPHVGLRLERPLTAQGLFLHGWSDIGVLPSLLSGIPLVDLRGEVGLTWRPARWPGVSLSLGLFNEAAGLMGVGFMTPGIVGHLSWHY